MTLIDLINERKGIFVLYWYDVEDNLVSEVVKPIVLSFNTVEIMQNSIESMARRNLFCLVFEEVPSDNVFIYNRGVLVNNENVVLRSDDFTVDESDKRMFYRYNISSDLMLMNKKHHERVHLNNISYTGVNIHAFSNLELGEEIMLYDPTENVPVYIPGEVVFKDDNGDYGIMICGNYDHINRIVIPNII